MKNKAFGLLFITLLFGISIVSASDIPTINSYVTDNSGVLSESTKQNLEARLRQLEKDTSGVQYIIFIEDSYPENYSLEEYTLKIAEQNKIGQEKQDNGILFYIAVKDREFRWEVGYGVESTLNTPLLGRISREYLIPNFKKGDYEKGILETYDVTEKILLNSNDPDIVKLKEESEKSKLDFRAFLIILFILIFFSILTYGIYQSLKESYNQNKSNFKKKSKSYYNQSASNIFFGGRGGGRFGGGSGGFSGGGGSFGGGGFSGRF